MAKPNAPTTSTPRPQDLQAGGRTTTTPNGIAHVAPGGNGTPAPGITPELLTTKQAAQLCGIGERTLWGWSRRGLAPPPIQIGDGTRRMVKYSRQVYLEWIAGGCKRVDGRDTER